MVMTQLYMVTT